MKFASLTALVLSLVLITPATLAATPAVTAKVSYIGTYGDGRTFVGLDAQINETGCSMARFDFPSNHPQAKSWLAIALTASTSGKNIVVQTNGCYAGLPTLSQGSDSYFYLQSN